MLEKMDAFFEARLDGYDAHMMANIASADEFYPFTASLLPNTPQSAVIDLGCGTGLELAWYFNFCPTAKVTGIDLSRKMLDAMLQAEAYLQARYPDEVMRFERMASFGD